MALSKEFQLAPHHELIGVPFGGHRAGRSFEANDFDATAPRKKPADQYHLSCLVSGAAS